MADDYEANRAYVSGKSTITRLPHSWTDAIGTVLYEEAGRRSSHMRRIDIAYRVMCLYRGDPPPSPTEFVRRMRTLVQYILHPDGEANPERLRQLIEDLGDHKKNEVWGIVLSDNPFCGPSIDLLEQMRDVWDLFNLSLDISDNPIRSNTFRDQLRHLFPKSTRVSTVQWFSVTIHDILKCGIKIMKTTRLQEHLNLEGDLIMLYVPDTMDMGLLAAYNYNVVAKWVRNPKISGLLKLKACMLPGN